jgi:hypothetical protein
MKRFNLVLWAIAAAAVLALALTGPDDVQADRDTQAAKADAIAQAQRDARRAKR